MRYLLTLLQSPRIPASLNSRILHPHFNRPGTYRHFHQARTLSFNAQTYSPDQRYSSANVNEVLKKSFLSEIPEEEAKTRIELAACYRLFELAGWNENIYNHLSAKVVEPDGSHSFLINPFGLKYGEITASSLVKVAYDGSIKNPGTTGDLFGINDAGFVIHSAIHKARPELKSVMHCHYPSATGVSCTNFGYLELAQTSHQVGPVSYHDYHGVVVDRGEQSSLVKDIGDKDILFLKNHGVITAAESVGAAWYLMYQLLAATDIQCAASACALGDHGNLVLPSRDTVERTMNNMRRGNFSGATYGVKELSAYMRGLDKLDKSYRL